MRARRRRKKGKQIKRYSPGTERVEFEILEGCWEQQSAGPTETEIRNENRKSTRPKLNSFLLCCLSVTVRYHSDNLLLSFPPFLPSPSFLP